MTLNTPSSNLLEHRIAFDQPPANLRLAQLANESLPPADGGPPSSRQAATDSPAAIPPGQVGEIAPAHLSEPSAPTSTTTDPAPLPEQLLDNLVECFRSVSEELQESDQRRQQSLAELQQLAVELGIAVAAKLCFDRTTAGPASDGALNAMEPAALQLVQQLSQSLDQPVECQVVLCPAEFELLQTALAETTHELYEAAVPQFSVDSQLGPGEYQVKTNNEQWISSLPLKINELRQTLLNSLDDAATERRTTETSNRLLRRFPERRATG